MSAIDTMTGISQGIENATKNLFNIMALKQRINQEKESFTLDKKIKELEIKKAEFLLSPEQIKAEQDKLKAETNARNAQFTLGLLKADEEQKKAQRELETHHTAMATLQQFMKNPEALPEGTTIKVGNVGVSRTRAPNYGMPPMANLDEPSKPASSSTPGFDFGSIFPSVSGSKSIVDTGMYNGRKVVKYSDGSVDYAPE